MEGTETNGVSAERALERLKVGSRAYRRASRNEGDISPDVRAAVSEEGQHPYAAIVTCSDSRVVPEHIFMAGIGELFTIRVAGNVMGPVEVASVLYAVSQVRVPLVLVLGHTRCGAVKAALAGDVQGPMTAVTDVISQAVGDERDDRAAALLNVAAQVERLLSVDEIAEFVASGNLEVTSALYRIEDGEVEFCKR